MEKALIFRYLLIVFWLCVFGETVASRDGFNVYKDFLRGRNDEGDLTDSIQNDDNADGLLSKVMYFYRTPLHSTEESAIVDSFKKRTVNKFKNMMINKDAASDSSFENDKDSIRKFYIPRAMIKREPGAILSWAIPTANRYRNLNAYRPPGMNRPAAVS